MARSINFTYLLLLGRRDGRFWQRFKKKYAQMKEFWLIFSPLSTLTCHLYHISFVERCMLCVWCLRKSHEKKHFWYSLVQYVLVVQGFGLKAENGCYIVYAICKGIKLMINHYLHCNPPPLSLIALTLSTKVIHPAILLKSHSLLLLS